MAEKARQWLKQGTLRSFDKVVVEDCMQTLVDLSQKVYGLGAPKLVNEEGTRSISQKQQIGVKRGVTIDISQELCGSSPNTSKSHVGRL